MSPSTNKNAFIIQTVFDLLSQMKTYYLDQKYVTMRAFKAIFSVIFFRF